MATTRSLSAAGPNALFKALLSGRGARARRLLESSSADQLTHTGPAGFTSLHAALVGGCAAVLPALVAAGAPLDSLLKGYLWDASMQQFLDSFNVDYHECPRVHLLWKGSTALAVAARYVCHGVPACCAPPPRPAAAAPRSMG
jgi:hypothetical protein